MRNQPQFVHLYPIPEYFKSGIESSIRFMKYGKRFKEEYKRVLNECIDKRYRKKGFGINYVVFKGSEVSDIIEKQEGDRILTVDIDFKTFTTEPPDGNYHYPDPEHIINELKTDSIVVAGFHLWDCVDNFARTVYEKGIHVLVDEDLTELLIGKMYLEGFRTDMFPSISPREIHKRVSLERFLSERRKRPWMHQYPDVQL